MPKKQADNTTKKRKSAKGATTGAQPTIPANATKTTKADNTGKADETGTASPSGGKILPADSGGADPTRPIGKGNPPRVKEENKFKPGKSGNPKGYPKGQLNASTIIKYWLSKKEVVEHPIEPGKLIRVTQTDLLVLKQIELARKGNGQAFTALMDRTEGKPVQSTKLLNAGGQELEIMVGFKAPVAAPKPETKNEEDINEQK